MLRRFALPVLLVGFAVGLGLTAGIGTVSAGEATQVLRPGGIEGFPHNFGGDLAVSGDAMIVGSSFTGPIPPLPDKAFDTIRAHIFERVGGVWTETQIIEHAWEVAGPTAPSVAIDGDWLAIGYPEAEPGGTSCGLVYLFQRSGDVWSEQQILAQAQPCSDDTHFGRRVAMSTGRMVVAGLESFSLYEFTGSEWTEKVGNVDLTIEIQDIDLSPDLVAVVAHNASGSPSPPSGLYAYNVSASAFEGPTVLEPMGTNINGPCDAVSIDGSRLVIGCTQANNVPPAQESFGAAFVFDKVGGLWTETATLSAPLGVPEPGGDDTAAGAAGDYVLSGDLYVAGSEVFGSAVSVAGDRILVGAPDVTSDDPDFPIENFPVGAAFEFSFISGSWVMVDVTFGQSTVVELATTSAHGWSVVISGDELIVGDPFYARDGRVSVFSTTKGRFSDTGASVFDADIAWLAGAGITKGCNPPLNTEFCPDDFVTRGQMAAFLVRALGLTDRIDNPFTDDDESIFEADIERLAAAGITKGCNPAEGNTRFCPDSKVTREQMAAFLVRALGYTDDGGGNLFIDDDDSIFEVAIDRVATAGVTKGCNPGEGNTRFCPTSYVTRGQMAAFLHRALG